MPKKFIIIENIFLLILLVAVINACIGLYQMNIKPDAQSIVDHSANYQAVIDQVAKSISKELATGEIHSVKRKIVQFVAENKISYIRVYDADNFLVVEYRDNHFLVDQLKNKSSSYISTEKNIAQFDSTVFDRYEIVGRVEIGFAENSGLSQVIQTERLGSLYALNNIISVSIFSFILGIYLTNIYLKIKVRLTNYDSQVSNRAVKIN